MRPGIYARGARCKGPPPMVWSPSGGPAPRSKKGPQIADTHRDSEQKSTKKVPRQRGRRGSRGAPPRKISKISPTRAPRPHGGARARPPPPKSKQNKAQTSNISPTRAPRPQGGEGKAPTTTVKQANTKHKQAKSAPQGLQGHRGARARPHHHRQISKHKPQTSKSSPTRRSPPQGGRWGHP